MSERDTALRPRRDALRAFLHPIAPLEGERVKSRIASYRFVRSLPRSVVSFGSASSIRAWAISKARPAGLFLELGTGAGVSTRTIAQAMKADGIAERLYTFDWFAGIPERWRTGVNKGSFARPGPPAVPENVSVVEGRFEETFAGFVEAHPGPVSFAHIDCDLYSSSHLVLSTLLAKGRLTPGSIALFDELFNYPGWDVNGEYKALTELLPETSYEVIGIVPSGQQVAIRWR